jgi:hypothetical protein
VIGSAQDVNVREYHSTITTTCTAITSAEERLKIAEADVSSLMLLISYIAVFYRVFCIAVSSVEGRSLMITLTYFTRNLHLVCVLKSAMLTCLCKAGTRSIGPRESQPKALSYRWLY